MEPVNWFPKKSCANFDSFSHQESWQADAKRKKLKNENRNPAKAWEDGGEKHFKPICGVICSSFDSSAATFSWRYKETFVKVPSNCHCYVERSKLLDNFLINLCLCLRKYQMGLDVSGHDNGHSLVMVMIHENHSALSNSKAPVTHLAYWLGITDWGLMRIGKDRPGIKLLSKGRLFTRRTCSESQIWFVHFSKQSSWESAQLYCPCCNSLFRDARPRLAFIVGSLWGGGQQRNVRK